jgi:hypothetical protein
LCAAPVAAPAGVGAAVVVAGIGAAAIVLGSFLTWASVTAPLVGTISKAGTAGDGVITLVLGLGVALLVGLGRASRRRAVWITAIVLAALAGLIVVVDGVDAAHRFSTLDTTYVTASIGPGIYVVGLGALAAIAGAVSRLRGHD